MERDCFPVLVSTHGILDCNVTRYLMSERFQFKEFVALFSAITIKVRGLWIQSITVHGFIRTNIFYSVYYDYYVLDVCACPVPRAAFAPAGDTAYAQHKSLQLRQRVLLMMKSHGPRQ
jgi:hypothetical protein